MGRLGAEIVNPIGCSDCHDTRSEGLKKGELALALTRPYVERACDTIDKNVDQQSRTYRHNCVDTGTKKPSV